MKEQPQVHAPATAPTPAREGMSAEPASAISDADLDKVSGGGGKAGGVVGSRACTDGPRSN
jgi:hypothetical protein